MASGADWTGAPTPNVAGALASTCNDWTMTTGTGTVGSPPLADTDWWNSGSQACSGGQRLYSVPQ